MKKSIFLLTFPALFAISSQAQEISIASTDIYTACEGAVVDSGLSAADYGANENQTITWCPEAPETVLNLYWVVFDLDAASTITIYDGDDNTASVVGTYSGDELQGEDIFSGDTNSSGCMTVEFVSGAGSSGNFGAYASCGYPCDRPFAIVNPTELQPMHACLNEPVFLESLSSTVADGQEIVSWVWDLGDGNTDNTSGPTVNHTYTQPGLYVMNLELTDDNDCQNNNVLDYQILVSTDPNFAGTSTDATICVGDEIDLTGMIEGVLYTAEPSVDFGGGLFIPDDQGACFSSELTFTSFYPNAVVEDANADIINAFINFEHSYMGDLTITFTCPNNQSILVHQQGGGTTFLGVPIDDDLDLAPGVGWDYYWEPLATNGTWGENAQPTLPAGSYESVQPFTNLNGCPLNGTWEVEVCDLWASDNGFIFDWSLEFAPYLYPEAISFTPTFGDGCDSTQWNGPSIVDNGADCSVVTILPSNMGVETYTFIGINDFGCLYEQSLDVTVVGVLPTIPSTSTQFCGSSVLLEVDLGDVDPGDCSFLWTWEQFGDVEVESGDITSPDLTITDLEITSDFTVTVSYDVPGVPGLTCVNDASIRVETCEITIPNVFTPDNNGQNDRWIVGGLAGFNNSKVQIFNRWGELVFSDLDFGSSPGWNPGKDGISEGVYYYILEINRSQGDIIVTNEEYPDPNLPFIDSNEGPVTFTGTITVFRDN